MDDFISIAEETRKTCTTCNEKVSFMQEIVFPLPFLVLDFSHISNHLLQLDSIVTVSINNTMTSYKLCGIVYFGHSHYIAHVITENNMVWFHDGITTGHDLIYEGMLNDNNILLNECKGKKATAAIYVMC